MILFFTVTNDLSYDQRMHRICDTLASNGYEVHLIGRNLPLSIPLEASSYRQIRLKCWFRKGFPFYAEYNLRLFGFLLIARYDAVCSIDLDTLPAGALATLIRRKKRVFDAHEYFTEVPEVVNRPFVKAFWGMVARLFLRFYRHAYTVGPALARMFSEKYGVPFRVVRNVPIRTDRQQNPPHSSGQKMVFYQGALNEGRGIETMLKAMQQLDNLKFVLAGEGDLSVQLRKMSEDLGLGDRVEFLGFVKPADLKVLTEQAWLGLNLLENRGLSYYYSLANKFFDSVQARVPVLTMDFPEYHALNAEHEVAILLPALTPEAVVNAIQGLINHPEHYEKLQENCRQACLEWNWEKEQIVLLQLWREVASA